MKNNIQAKIIRFIPTIEKQAEKNLEHLIAKAKSSKAFGDIQWEETAWTVFKLRMMNLFLSIFLAKQ